MAGSSKRISELDAAAALAGTEAVAVVQSGGTVRTTVAAIRGSASEVKTLIGASATHGAGLIPILDEDGEFNGNIKGNAATADLAGNSTEFAGYTYEELVTAMKLALHPVGSFYVQYPDASSNTDATEFPESQRPATLFGGTWAEQWSDESVFFRTRGTLSDSGRTSGKQEDAFQGFKIQKSGSSNSPANGNWSDNYVMQVTSPNTAGQTANFGNIVSDGANGTPRIAAETRGVNRRIKVWKRTA